MDATHGTDYLIDYYALLGLEREADPAAIKSAYHEKQRQYHPDRYEGLAPELKARAEEKSRLFAEVYATLSDPARRATYDRRLAEWQGPISRDGTPIVDLSRPHFRPETLLGGGLNDVAHEQLAKRALQMSGHDPNTLALLEKLIAASEKLDLEMIEAYGRALACKETYLAVLEAFEWERAGFKNQPTEERPVRQALQLIEAQIVSARAKAADGVAETLLLVAAGEIKLLAPGGTFDSAAPSAHDVLNLYRDEALAHFDAAVARIGEIAKERAANAEKALKLIRGDYDPPEQPMRPKLLVIVLVEGRETPMAFRLVGTAVEPEKEAPFQVEALAAGYSVMRLQMREGLHFRDQLEQAVLAHFERWSDQMQKT